MITPINPFKGAKSYEEGDSQIFFGREKEIEELYQLVRINLFTLLYGRSGLGKTSILQAGLFPLLRANNYLPIYIRPPYVYPNTDLIKEVESFIFSALKSEEIETRIIRSKELLWEYFHNTFITSRITKKRLIPVLVFDQFEEIFTLGTEDRSSEPRDNTKDLIKFLADLIENTPPQSLDESQRLNLQYSYGNKLIPIKIIFSFREEYLSNFYSLSNLIPSIAYSNLQYRLYPLTFDEGYKVIKNAAKELFDEKAITQTLLRITDTDGIVDAQKRDIDSLLLSIFCEYQIDQLFKNHKNLINADDIKNVDIQGLVNSIYDDVVYHLSLNESEKKLLEEKLLSPEGYRLPVYLEVALKDSAIRREKVEALEEKKILKRYFVDGRICIEIIHDKFAAAIKRERDFRKDAELKQLKIIENQKELEKTKVEEERKLAEERRLLDEKTKYENDLIAKEKDILRERELNIKLSKQKKRLIYSLLISLTILIIYFAYNTYKLSEDKIAQKNNVQNQLNQLPSMDSSNSFNLNGSPRVANSVIHDTIFVSKDSTKQKSDIKNYESLKLLYKNLQTQNNDLTNQMNNLANDNSILKAQLQIFVHRVDTLRKLNKAY
jgi:hypothetical protein